jgi:8-oxo-dGTP pyrophosphatase MutT (NUDIX family)
MLKLFYMTNRKIKQKVQIVISTSKEILLLQLNEERGSFWQNATGSVEKNEEYIEGARRELLEETGIESPVNELPMQICFHDRWGQDVVEKVFHCLLPKKVKIILSEEHQKFKWVPFKSLTPDHYEFLNHFQAALLAKDNSK